MSREPQDRPTLLVFTLGAAAEVDRRRLLPARFRAVEARFRRACLDTALSAGRGSGCRLEVSSPRPLGLPADVFPAPQQGAHFGARLDRAMRAALGRRAGPVVVVGSDVPGLTSDLIDQALAVLRDRPEAVVLGPSPDGGFYLLATRTPVDGLAEDVRWCSRATLESLCTALRAAGRPVVLLAPRSDLDEPADLERWLARGTAETAPSIAAWRPILRRLLAECRRVHPPSALAPPPGSAIAAVAVRGPPPATLATL
jgi:hypothetical protein